LNKEIKKVWVDLLNALVAKQDERLLQAEKSKAHVDELYKDLMVIPSILILEFY
jgi:hypothetical protein